MSGQKILDGLHEAVAEASRPMTEAEKVEVLERAVRAFLIQAADVFPRDRLSAIWAQLAGWDEAGRIPEDEPLIIEAMREAFKAAGQP